MKIADGRDGFLSAKKEESMAPYILKARDQWTVLLPYSLRVAEGFRIQSFAQAVSSGARRVARLVRTDISPPKILHHLFISLTPKL